MADAPLSLFDAVTARYIHFQRQWRKLLWVMAPAGSAHPQLEALPEGRMVRMRSHFGEGRCPVRSLLLEPPLLGLPLQEGPPKLIHWQEWEEASRV